MHVWKILILVLIVMLFNTCRYNGYVKDDLKSAWTEVNQEKDIFAYYDSLKEESFIKFTNGVSEEELHLLDIKISQEENLILLVQSLIESAHSSEILILMK